MGLTYVIADLHGRFDLLQDAYEVIAADSDTGRIVHLGDYVDRGPESRQIVEWLMDDATIPAGFTRVCLKGNHEDMMVATLSAPLDPNWWIGNGGGATLLSYGHEPRGDYTPSVVPQSHIDWMRGLPHFHEDAHRFYVHAGVDPTKQLSDQTDEMLLWYRYERGANIGFGDKHVVHGHTPSPSGPELFEHRTNLDTYAWKTGRLSVAVLTDSVPGGPGRIIEITGPVFVREAA